MVLPVITVVSLPANIFGMGYTVTLISPVSAKQLSLSRPITVYNMVEPGDAPVLAALGLSSPAAGYHWYFSAPEARRVMCSPAHMVSPACTCMANGCRTRTFTVSFNTHPFTEIPVTTYEVLVTGLIMGAAQP